MITKKWLMWFIVLLFINGCANIGYFMYWFEILNYNLWLSVFLSGLLVCAQTYMLILLHDNSYKGYSLQNSHKVKGK